jgi:predicted peptidase
VVCLHDSSAFGRDVGTRLRQGYGALVWATAEAQRRHPAFVLAPQFSETIANDDFQFADQGVHTFDLIQQVAAQYGIDTDRIYLTGQSMGCMSTFALNIAHPGTFGGSLCVAGQWDPARMAPLAREDLNRPGIPGGSNS